MGAILLFFAVALPVAGVFFIRQTLFLGNRHFVLQNIELDDAGGYWETHLPELREKAGLKVKQDNLFRIDYRATRRIIEAIPNVESCEIYRILPSTLKIKITERIPRAVIAGHRLVVDKTGTVMSSGQVMQTNSAMPVLFNFGTAVPGGKLQNAAGALELLMDAVRSFPDFKILYIQHCTNGKYRLGIDYRSSRKIYAVFPQDLSSEHLRLTRLAALQAALAEPENARRSEYDLSFDNRVIVK